MGRSQIEGMFFLLHGGRESTEDTEVFEALCFFRVGFTIKKLREWLEGRGIERPAVILGGWCIKIYGGCIFCYTEEGRARRKRRFLRRFAFESDLPLRSLEVEGMVGG